MTNHRIALFALVLVAACKPPPPPRVVCLSTGPRADEEKATCPVAIPRPLEDGERIETRVLRVPWITNAALPMYLHVLEATPTGLDPAKPENQASARLLAQPQAWNVSVSDPGNATVAKVKAVESGAQLVALTFRKAGTYELEARVGELPPASVAIDVIEPVAFQWKETEPLDGNRFFFGAFSSGTSAPDLFPVFEFNRRLCCVHAGGRFKGGACTGASEARDPCIAALESRTFKLGYGATCDDKVREAASVVGTDSPFAKGGYSFTSREPTEGKDPSMSERFGKGWDKLPICLFAKWPAETQGCVAALAGIQDGCAKGFESASQPRPYVVPKEAGK